MTLYPAFAKTSAEEQLGFFRKQVNTDAQAKKLHAKYLKLSGNDSNTRKTKRRVKKDNA